MKFRFHKKIVMLTSSSGGHLTQLIRIENSIRNYKKVLITEKTKNTLTIDKEVSQCTKILFLPHGGRENYFVFLFKFLYNFLISFFRYFFYRPKVIIMTGAHTVVPMAFIAKVFGTKIIYVETFAKMNTPSLTGKIIYLISDSFYIQWPKLKKFFPKSKYRGKIY